MQGISPARAKNGTLTHKKREVENKHKPPKRAAAYSKESTKPILIKKWCAIFFCFFFKKGLHKMQNGGIFRRLSFGGVFMRYSFRERFYSVLFWLACGAALARLAMYFIL